MELHGVNIFVFTNDTT